MFYCEKCRELRAWPESLGTSYGRCEICQKLARCFDRPSASLPLHRWHDKNEPTLGVAIGRFQNRRLTIAHKALINTALSQNTYCLVIIGSQDKHFMPDNPLTFEMRKDMILSDFPTVGIVGISDIAAYIHFKSEEAADREWSAQVDIRIRDYAHQNFILGKKTTLYHGRDSFSKHYYGQYELCEIQELAGVSASAERNSLNPINSEDFRAGVIYASRKVKRT